MSPMMAVDLGLSFSSPSFSLFESSAPLVSSQRTSRTINLSNPSSLSRNSSSRVTCQISTSTETTTFLNKNTYSLKSKKIFSNIPRSSGSSSSEASEDGMKASNDKNKAPFGYSRKDVLLIGLGVTLVGIGLESGLEFVGVDPLKAGNAVQLVMVLGLTIGWISTYIFRVSNKDMTYAQQLRDYEYKVMERPCFRWVLDSGALTCPLFDSADTDGSWSVLYFFSGLGITCFRCKAITSLGSNVSCPHWVPPVSHSKWQSLCFKSNVLPRFTQFCISQVPDTI